MKYYITKWFAILLLLIGVNSGVVHAQTALEGENFGDWVVSCKQLNEAKKQCQMSQLALVEASNEPLMRMDLKFQRPYANGEIIWRMPLGISVQKNPRLYLDGNWVKEVYIDFCLSDGCYTRVQMNRSLMEKFLRMTSGELRVESGAGRTMNLPISGSGSRAAFNFTQ